MSGAVEEILRDVHSILDSTYQELQTYHCDLCVEHSLLALSMLEGLFQPNEPRDPLALSDQSSGTADNFQDFMNILSDYPVEFIRVDEPMSNDGDMLMPMLSLEEQGHVESSTQTTADRDQTSNTTAEQDSPTNAGLRRSSNRLRQRAVAQGSPGPTTPGRSSSSRKMKSTTSNPSSSDYLCPICFESCFRNQPTTTQCGHVFCHKCIITALKNSCACPICKKNISTNRLTRLFI